MSAAAALAGSPEALARLEAGEDPARIAAGWAADESRWRLRRGPYLLYP
jgi:exo-beta-N-acetylmuramidase NamZ-like protein